MRSFLSAFLLLFVSVTHPRAQDPGEIAKKIDGIAAKLQLNDSLRFSTDLFLHLDKSLYVSNEPIWFAAYLLNNPAVDEPHTLHAILVNDMTQQKVAAADYVLQHGMASGSMLIPGSMQSGAYSLIAYTNGYPLSTDSRFFRQPIRVVAAKEPPFNLQFSSNIKEDVLLIKGKLVRKQGGDFNGKIAYSVYADGKLAAGSTARMDATSDLPISIPLPADLNSVEIFGTLMGGSDSMHFRLPVKGEATLSQLQFFPETGQLVNGQRSNMFFLLQNHAGKAISTHLTLLEDTAAFATFSSDVYGKGNFSFTPVYGKTYTVKTREDSKLPLQRFPPVAQVAAFTIQAGNIADDIKLAKTRQKKLDIARAKVVAHRFYGRATNIFCARVGLFLKNGHSC